jgi:hypothetical protein
LGGFFAFFIVSAAHEGGFSQALRAAPPKGADWPRIWIARPLAIKAQGFFERCQAAS